MSITKLTAIKDLKPDMQGVSVSVYVLYKIGIGSKTCDGREAHMFQVADAGASIVAIVWDHQGTILQPKKIFHMRNCTTALWTGCLHLYAAREDGCNIIPLLDCQAVSKARLVRNDMSRFGLFRTVQPSTPDPFATFNERALTVKRNLELYECRVVSSDEEVERSPPPETSPPKQVHVIEKNTEAEAEKCEEQPVIEDMEIEKNTEAEAEKCEEQPMIEDMEIEAQDEATLKVLTEYLSVAAYQETTSET